MKVTLIGAGPGDKGLLTLKGAQRIGQADVVLYDRFVSEEILAEIPDAAEKIDVGKSAGNHPVPQDEINLLLLEKAKQGLNVVRLKGGDPFVFGRGGEELELLAENGIPFEVVPGITTAIAGAAYAGIPVTHREYASSMHIITGHGKNNKNPDINYEALTKAGGTLVFMMGVSAIGDICKGCIAAGMDKNTPAAVVENATKSAQRKIIATVENLAETAKKNDIQSPAVIIIGKVCSLSQRYDWFGQKSMLGKHIVVARAKPGTSKLTEKLRELGCKVTEMPPAKITPLTIPGSALEKTLEKIKSYSWLVFTSSTGVNVFFDYLIGSGKDIRELHHLKIAAVGSETEKELKKRGIKTDYCPPEFSGESLAKGLSKLLKTPPSPHNSPLSSPLSPLPSPPNSPLSSLLSPLPSPHNSPLSSLNSPLKSLVPNGEKILIARAKDGAENLTLILKAEGIEFDDVPIYEKAYDAKGIIPADCEIAAFTSSSAVEWFAKNAGNTELGRIKAFCIGRRTAATAQTHGMEVCISKEATIESLVEEITMQCRGDY